MQTCHYCKFWKAIESKLRSVDRSGKKAEHYRFCRKVGHDVQSNSEPCDFFRPTDYFWCNADDGWVHILSCLNRDCSCHQKDDVTDAIRGFDIRKEFNMKPRLIKRKVEIVKPKLRLIPRKKPTVVKKKKKKLLLVKRVK